MTLNQFLTSVQKRAFITAKLATDNEDDALNGRRCFSEFYKMPSRTGIANKKLEKSCGGGNRIK